MSRAIARRNSMYRKVSACRKNHPGKDYRPVVKQSVLSRVIGKVRGLIAA